MSRTFQSELNSNLHPNFFEFKDVPQPERRTVSSIEKGDLMWSKPGQKYKQKPMFDKGKRQNYASKVLTGIQEVSEFSLLFFSMENIKYVQQLIRYNVYVNTENNYVIGEQDETELLIRMRGIYLQYSKIPSDKRLFKQEIKRLNSLVITNLLPELVSNIEQHLGYLRDSSQAYRLIDRGTNPSIKGQRDLRSVSDVLVGDDNFFNSNY